MQTTSLHAAKWIAIWSVAIVGVGTAAFGYGQGAAVPDSLVRAVERGDMAVIRARLSSGANPNEADDSVAKGWTPLMAAAYTGNVDAVRLLLKSGAAMPRRHVEVRPLT